MDDDIDWNAFQERACHRANNTKKTLQHAIVESDNGHMLDNLSSLPSVNDKPIWSVKCWVSLKFVC